MMDLLGRSNSPISARTGLDDIVVGIVLVLVSAGILNLVLGRLREALARVEANELTQEAANRALRELQTSLEQRVEARTEELRERGLELETANGQIQRRAAQLETLAQVMKTITSVRDLQELLPRIAAVISERFGFYHVGVFLLDEVGEYAILSAANSAGGQKMLARKHRLRVGEEGIVGFVTSAGTPRIAMDVGKDPVFFNNPDLPATHSELAVPLQIEGRVVGALDVQSEETGAFTDEDVQMLSLLADQVSLAIENARLFDETRTALAQAEAVSRQFVREAWSRLPVEHQLVGYRYSVAGASPLHEPLELTGPVVGKSPNRSPESNQVAVPIELRGETIGTLVVQAPSEEDLSEDQLDLIKAVAERVALSAENARLFEETTRRAERERLVSDITSKIRSTPDPQSMVQTAIEELRKALGASRVEVIPQAVKGVEKS
jgi:GAF domain-containing protein